MFQTTATRCPFRPSSRRIHDAPAIYKETAAREARAPKPSDLHLGAQLHQAVAGQQQEVGHPRRVVVHLAEQLLAPQGQAAVVVAGHEHVAREEVAGAHALHLAATAAQLLQSGRYVGVVLEAVVDLHRPAVAAQRFDLHALVHSDPWHLMVDDGDEDVLLVQHLVVLEVVQQRVGRHLGVGRQEHRRAGHARDRRLLQQHHLQEVAQVNAVGMQLVVDKIAPALPGRHHGEHRDADGEREPATLQQLEHVGRKEREVNAEEEQRGCERHPQRVLPAIAQHEEGEHGGDRHVQRHRNAVGGRQIAAGAEHHHRQRDRHAQAPVDERNVDLPHVAHAGVLDLDAWQVAQLDHLLGDAEGAGDQRLRCDHRGHGGQHHQRNHAPAGGQHVERVLDGVRVLQHQRALAEVAQRERGHGNAEPGEANRLAAKVAHVGIERLGTRHAQHHRAQDDEAHHRVVEDEAQRIVRAQAHQNAGVLVDVPQPQQPDADEPHQHHRAKELADARRAAFLQHEQCNQHHHGERNNALGKVRRDDLQPLDGRQHRDCRRDHPVAIEQAGAEDADHHQHGAQPGFVLHRLRRQGQHGDEPAFAVVVGAQHQHNVLQRHDQRQRPEQDGQDAVDVVVGERNMARAEHLLERIQNTGADVSVDNTDRAQSERGKG
ncbi:hypothetical protein SDC9_78968 [bioreactor metagenome]|uniref:Uncharacterized protein n=1 Tax=bioreactor metagenome TaxID=1076179 RepID=A0A644YV42_9ZZZZ